MVACRSQDCRYLVDEDWDFCAHCGFIQHGVVVDPDKCDHQIEIVGPHCVKCGQSFSEEDQPRWVGVLATVAGFLALGLCFATIGLVPDKGLVRLASYGVLPALALLGYGAKLLIPDSN
ncbi:MAG: hypothetical protein ACAH95_01635 [Fimbriimonas sp.]